MRSPEGTRIVVAGALLAETSELGLRVRARWDHLRPAWCRTPLLHVTDDEDAALVGAATFASGSHLS